MNFQDTFSLLILRGFWLKAAREEVDKEAELHLTV